jgi:phosphatidylserine decarboxylase
VDSPDDDTVLVGACEATPFALKSDVKLRDTFWLKGQPYSLQDMLDQDDSAKESIRGMRKLLSVS